MASGDDILKALMGVYEQPKETTAGMMSTVIGGMAPRLVNPYGSAGSNIALTAGAGLLSGLLGGYAKNIATSDNQGIGELSRQFLAANQTGRDSIAADNDKFQGLNAALMSRDYEHQQKIADADALDAREALTGPAADLAVTSLGLPAGTNMKPAQLRALTNAVAQKRLAEGQKARLEGDYTTAPSKDTKSKMGDALLAKQIGDRYLGEWDNVAAKDPGYLERNVLKELPATEVGKLQKDLELFAVQVRNARENGVMTEQDFQRYKNYLTLTDLDTVKSVRNRLKELMDITDISAKSTLRNAKAGKENVSGYMDLWGFSPEDLNGLPAKKDIEVGAATPTAERPSVDLSEYTPEQISFMKSKGMIP